MQAPPSFPFPSNFHADRVIGLYDDNNNDVVDTATGGSALRTFPVGDPADGAPGRGAHFGSRKIQVPPGVDSSTIPPVQFCGDVILYGEQTTSTGVTNFVWVSVLAPNRPPKLTTGCSGENFDVGIGSYTGTWFNPRNVRQATFFGGLAAGSTFLSNHWYFTAPGGLSNPGHFFSISPDPTAAWPALWPGGVAVEVTALATTAVPYSSMLIDVPLVSESAWDGATLFNTQYPFGRSIQPQTAPLGLKSVSLWSNAMADASNPFGTPYTREQYSSIKFADVNGDGYPDLCYRVPSVPVGYPNTAGWYCALSDGRGSFGSPTRWTSSFGFLSPDNELYWGTFQLADVNGDGKADVRGRLADGFYCALSNGSGFDPPTLWAPAFSDANGWGSSASFWGTIRLADVNGDGRTDVCGRGAAGIYCAVSNGTSFGPVTLWTSQFNNADGWAADWYWKTISFADINGDGRADVCGRGAAGIICATSAGPRFNPSTLWTTQFSDAAGWQQPQYYSTIHLADINHDGKADICGRGTGGVYCAMSNGSSFVGGFTLNMPAFSDANGWNVERFYRTIALVDVNHDGNADVCGRGGDGIYCALSLSTDSTIAFTPATKVVDNFGDNYGWGSGPEYWATVQPFGAGFCGRGNAGILCSAQ